MEIWKPDQVKEYYREKNTVDEYIRNRFNEPLNKVEHLRQVTILNDIIEKNDCKFVVEFAPGPARVTTEIKTGEGVSIDSSENMLELAKERMKKKGKKWKFIHADILNSQLKLSKKADLLFCFRFLLHFQKGDRAKIYRQAANILKKEGLLVFEAMNGKIVHPVRKILGKKRYFIYDHLYDKPELFLELEQNGFKIIRLYPVLKHFKTQAILSRPLKFMNLNLEAERVIREIEKIPTSDPYQWVVLCQKKL